MRREVYFPGGYDSTKPNGNVAESWDDEAGTYIRHDAEGAVAESRPLTSQERERLTASAQVGVAGSNRRTIEDAARNALATNRAYIAQASPNAAQNAAQVKALTRQVNALTRLVLGQLDGTD